MKGSIFKLIALVCPAVMSLAVVEGKKEQINVFKNLDGIPHHGEDKKRPNILIILADDVGTGDLPVYYNGSTALVDMPNIQRLAGMGVTFLDAHASPLCAPSRYMLLSGNYPHRGRKTKGTWTIGGNHNQFRENQKSIAEALQEQANYTTAMFGKWHVGGKIPVTEGWSNTDIRNRTHMLTHKGYDWSQPLIEGPQDTGFASSFITPNGIQNSPYAFLRDGYLTMDVSEARTWPRGMRYTGQYGKSEVKRQGEGDPNWESSAYNMIIVNETEAFLDNHLASESDDPFFAYVALGAVHVPHTPPDYYLDGTLIAGKYPSPHMDMLFEMDKAVGSVVSMVEDRGLAEDTIIIFASDNGGIKPANDSSEYGHDSHGPLRGYKGSVYEGGHRVPLIFRWDGNFPAGETRSKLVSITDIYKTLCQITDIKKPAGSAVDSHGLTEYIYSGNNTSSLKRNFGAWDFVRKDFRINAESIQSDNLKLVVHYDYETNTRKSELYDLDKDIGETNNIASQNVKMRKKLLRRLRKIGPCPKKDVNKSFNLAEAAGQRVTCQYFRDDISRCNLFFVGEINCPTICQSRFPALCTSYL
jgi:arylsulfatase A-like enzyme